MSKAKSQRSSAVTFHRSIISPFSTGYSDNDDEPPRKKNVLVLGSSGCLGRTVCRHLATELDAQVFGADVVELPNDTETMLEGFIPVPNLKNHPRLSDITLSLVEGVAQSLAEEEQLDAIICASGGWQGDPEVPHPGADYQEILAGATAYGETIDQMISMNLYPVVAAGYVAHRFMGEEGKKLLHLSGHSHSFDFHMT